MDNKKEMDSQEIDLIDFLGHLLEQWRGWMAVAIVCAFLFPMALGLLRGNETPSPDDSVWEQLQSEENFDDVVAALSYYYCAQETREYNNTSLLMRYPLSELKRISVLFDIISDENVDRQAVRDAYCLIASSDELYRRVGSLIGEEDNEYISELVTVSEDANSINKTIIPRNNIQGSESQGGVFVVSVILPRSYDDEQISNEISDYLSEYRDSIINSFGTHDISISLVQNSPIKDETTSIRKTTELSYPSTYTKKYTDAKAALTAQKQALLSKVIGEFDLEIAMGQLSSQDSAKVFLEELHQAEKSTNQDAENNNETRKHYSIKYVLIGFVAGLILYVGCYLMYCLTFNRMRRESVLADSDGLRNFGGIYQYPYKGIISTLLHDRKIYTWRHKASGDALSSEERVLDNMTTRIRFEGLTGFSRIILGKQSAWTIDILRRQDKEFAKAGVTFETFSYEKASVEMEDETLLSMKPAVIYIASGTPLSEVDNVLARCRDYQIPVLGTVFLEGPTKE